MTKSKLHIATTEMGIQTGIEHESRVYQLTYRQNAWHYIWCSNKCGKAHYIKHCETPVTSKHKRFNLLIGQNDVVHYDIKKIPAFCLTKSFQMVRQMDCQCVNSQTGEFANLTSDSSGRQRAIVAGWRSRRHMDGATTDFWFLQNTLRLHAVTLVDA